MSRALGATLLVALGATACGSAGDEPAGLSDPTETAGAADTSDPADGADPEDSPTAGQDGTDGAEPTGEPPVAEPVEHVFPEAGLTVVLPPSADGVEAAALAAYVEYAREWRWSLREVTMSEELSLLAVPDVVDVVQRSLDYQVANGIRYAGEMVITPVVDQTGTNLVILGGCIDASALRLVDDGQERLPDGIAEHPVIPMQVTLANDGSGWRVNENLLREGESC